MTIEIVVEDLDSATEFADFVELCLILAGEASLSRAEIAGRLTTRSPSDAQLELAIQEVRERRRRLGEVYPFNVEDGVIVRTEERPEVVPVYVALAILSADQSVGGARRDVGTGGQILDEIVARGLARRLGAGAQAVVFAHPALNPLSSTNDFRLRVRALASRLGLGLEGPTTPAFLNDGGVDVVAWRRFDDDLNGFELTLAQCTYQRDYVTKRLDISREDWSKYLIGAGAFSKALAVPRIVDRASSELIAPSTEVILDRLRLSEVFTSEPLVDGGLAQVVREFIHRQLASAASTGPDGIVRPARQRRPKRTAG